MNFYEEKLQELKKLLKKKDYQAALQIINLELSMPYIPKDFEEALLKIKAQIPLDAIRPVTRTLPPEEVFTLLLAPDLDSVEKIGLVQSLQAINLRNYVEPVQKLLASELDNEIKMILCYFLVEQNVDYDFIYQKKPKNLVFNPMTFDLASQEMVPMKVIEELTTILTPISPQLLEMAKQVTINFYAKLFPIETELQLDLLAKAVINLVFELNNLPLDLPYNCSAEQAKTIDDYVAWIKELNAI